jgi:hypothetical protein
MISFAGVGAKYLTFKYLDKLVPPPGRPRETPSPVRTFCGRGPGWG